MQIDHTLTIHAPMDRVWPLVQKPEAVVESLPGVTLTSLDGEDFSGKMSVGLGPMRLQYGGKGTLRYDEAARSIHIEAAGSEARGAGSASAVVDVSVHEGAEGSTRLDVSIDLELQGKPAQFGRGILSEVVTRLATQFGKNLERQVLQGPVGEAQAPPAAVEPERTAVPAALSAPARAAQSVAPGAWAGQAVGILAGALLGAAVTSILGARRSPSVSLTIIGTDDPAWIDLAREIASGRRS
ncbi:SRPBCC family protein [Janibacter sp. GS2]|uniref:SRPBCC family protein n=1 Tax=Janibacter sp. GS2 TaxID=3442646 RepID=UPI003EB9C82D